MSFSSDVSKFVSKSTSKIEEMQVAQKEKIAAFLQEFLGDEAKTITKIKFDNEALKFYDVEASEAVIKKLGKAGYLMDLPAKI